MTAPVSLSLNPRTDLIKERGEGDRPIIGTASICKYLAIWRNLGCVCMCVCACGSGGWLRLLRLCVCVSSTQCAWELVFVHVCVHVCVCVCVLSSPQAADVTQWPSGGASPVSRAHKENNGRSVAALHSSAACGDPVGLTGDPTAPLITKPRFCLSPFNPSLSPFFFLLFSQPYLLYFPAPPETPVLIKHNAVKSKKSSEDDGSEDQSVNKSPFFSLPTPSPSSSEDFPNATLTKRKTSNTSQLPHFSLK